MEENQELIVVEQLPVIKEQLKNISTEIDKEVTKAKSLVCTEENIKTVKEVRAKLNNTFKSLEEKRKEVKKSVMQPYEDFEKTYKECITNKFKDADGNLKIKIDTLENENRKKKEEEIRKYFDEYKKANNIDFIKFEQANINVTLTASIKSLKEQAKAFIDKIVDDLKLIEIQEHKAEILVEYKQTLNVSQAITTVTNRFKAVEEEKKKQEVERIEKENINKQEETKNEKEEPTKKEVQEDVEEFKVFEQSEFKVIDEKQKIVLEIFATELEYEDLEKYLELKNIEFKKGF